MIAQGILITGAALLAGAQSPEKQSCEQWSKDHWNGEEWSRVSDVLGSEVRMRSAPGSDERPGGELEELLLDPHTGKVSWAVVSCGGALGMGEHEVAVPASKLKWNSEQEGWELSMTEDQLKSSPDFDLSKARDQGPEAAFLAVEASWNAEVFEFPRFAHEQDTKTMMVGDMEVRACTANFILASELDEHTVYARSEEFGDVSGSVFDLRNNRVAYAIVDRGGVMGIGEDEFLIPFGAMMVRERPDGSETILCIDRPASEVESSHRYEQPEDGVISKHAAHEARECCHSQS